MYIYGSGITSGHPVPGQQTTSKPKMIKKLSRLSIHLRDMLEDKGKKRELKRGPGSSAPKNVATTVHVRHGSSHSENGLIPPPCPVPIPGGGLPGRRIIPRGFPDRRIILRGSPGGRTVPRGPPARRNVRSGKLGFGHVHRMGSVTLGDVGEGVKAFGS